MLRTTAILAAALSASVAAQTPPPRQTQADDYTRYELLEPGSGKFRIWYEVTATTPGATEFFNVIRPGSVASNERVLDRMTGQPLVFDVVGAAAARAGGVRDADSTTQYIRVKLARPVPAEGQARILIDKTYYDPKSYYQDGGPDSIVFSRPLGIKRNAVVLPAGYELVSCNYPSQVIKQPDGRLAVAFWNNTPAQAPLVIRARRAAAGQPSAGAEQTSPPPERAHQDRAIVYFLQQPATHAFDLYHDYTESRPGVKTYVNVVREGSTVSHPSGRLLDTGEDLTWEIVKGDAVRRAEPDAPGVTPSTVAVVFHFAAVKPGQSVRLRMFETYTDTARYKLDGDQLYWHRSFSRPANAVVLPAGWWLANSSIPATVTETADGRVRLDFINPRPDEIDVLVTARRR